MSTKLDSRQITYSGSLLRVATTNPTELDNIIASLDAESKPPLMMRADTGTARQVTIDALELSNPETGERRTIPPINDTIPSFTSGTLLFPTTTAGTVTVTPGSATAMPTMVANEVVRCGVFLNDTGNLELSFGTVGASEAAAGTPLNIVRTFAIGQIIVRTDGSGNIQDIPLADVVMYIGGGSGSGGGLVLESQNSAFTAEAGKHYLVDTSGGPVTVTLPAGDDGSIMRFTDAAQTFDSNNLTLDPAAGEQIAEGAVDENYVIDVKLGFVQLQWDSVQGLWTLDSALPADSTLQVASETQPGIVSTGTQTFAGDKTFSNDLTVSGNLTVNGTTTTINTATLDVEDINITVNKNGNDATSQGAGLTVERTGTNGSLVYDSALDSKFKAGNEGSESKILTSSSSISTDASHLGGYGLVPVGFIGAYSPGYFTSTTNGGYENVGPASNIVADVNAFLNSKGWYVCNGAAVNVAASPIWNAANRHLPNLDDGRFLRGSTQAGTQDGSATASIDHTHSVTSNVEVANHTLTTANLPSHNHSVGTYSVSVALSNNEVASSSHSHFSGIIKRPDDLWEFHSLSSVGVLNTTTPRALIAVEGGARMSTSYSTGSVGFVNAFATSGPSATTTVGASASISGNSGYTGSGTAVTHSVTNNAVTTLGASVTSISIEPTYLNTFYIIRVF